MNSSHYCLILILQSIVYLHAWAGVGFRGFSWQEKKKITICFPQQVSDVEKFVRQHPELIKSSFLEVEDQTLFQFFAPDEIKLFKTVIEQNFKLNTRDQESGLEQSQEDVAVKWHWESNCSESSNINLLIYSINGLAQKTSGNALGRTVNFAQAGFNQLIYQAPNHALVLRPDQPSTASIMIFDAGLLHLQWSDTALKNLSEQMLSMQYLAKKFDANIEIDTNKVAQEVKRYQISERERTFVHEFSHLLGVEHEIKNLCLNSHEFTDVDKSYYKKVFRFINQKKLEKECSQGKMRLTHMFDVQNFASMTHDPFLTVDEKLLEYLNWNWFFPIDEKNFDPFSVMSENDYDYLLFYKISYLCDTVPSDVQQLEQHKDYFAAICNPHLLGPWRRHLFLVDSAHNDHHDYVYQSSIDRVFLQAFYNGKENISWQNFLSSEELQSIKNQEIQNFYRAYDTLITYLDAQWLEENPEDAPVVQLNADVQPERINNLMNKNFWLPFL